MNYEARITALINRLDRETDTQAMERLAIRETVREVINKRQETRS